MSNEELNGNFAKPMLPAVVGSSKKYSVIYADPAWSYNDKRTGAGKNNPNGAGGALKHYSTMSTDEICKLPIQEISADSCMLFMWATSPLLPDAFKVMDAWGFKYKTVGFVWAKTTNDQMKIRGDGIGNYTIQNAEFCLIGLKGKYWRNKTGVKQFILSPKAKHSEKPNETRNRILELCGDLPRVELFARQNFEGWDAWGNEVSNSIELNAANNGR
jgi:site-specific DNA-methyltransferase (adenine-specific)